MKKLHAYHLLRGVVAKLIVFNTLIFVLVIVSDWIAGGISGTKNPVFSFLELTSGWATVVGRAWSLLTYGIVHANILHLLFNMLLLYFFGRVYTGYLSVKSFLGLYIAGILCGGLCFLTMTGIFGEGSQNALVGASAGIYALMLASTIYVPEFPVNLMGILHVRLWKITLVILALSAISSLSRENPGGTYAHLGGALCGTLYGLYFKARIRASFGFHSWYFPFLSVKRNQKKAKKRTSEKEEYDYNLQKIINQRKVDMILDKISASGFESLTREEKDFLFKVSDKG